MEPQPRLGLAALTRIAYEGADLKLLERELLAQYANGSASASTLMDLSVVSQITGNLELGLQWQAKALEHCKAFRTHRPQPAARTLLVFAAATRMGANTPVEFLLPGDAFNIVTYYLDAAASSSQADQLPPHDVAFCAMPADADDAEQTYKRVRDLCRDTGIRVLNLPDTLIKPERDTLPELLADVAGLSVPKTVRIARDVIKQALQDDTEERIFDSIGRYPFVCRPVGSHAGLGLEKIETKDAFYAYLASRDEQNFFVSEFVDYASQHDARFRKFRVIVVDGKPFPCHMAISDQWDVWYMNAKMSESADKRLEEAAFMNSFHGGFGKRHAHAIRQLAQKLGLDYFGLDCAEDQNGNLIVFEVDNALIVHDMDCKTLFPYKEKHVQRVFAAFEKMLSAQCRGADGDVLVPDTSSNSPLWPGRQACA